MSQQHIYYLMYLIKHVFVSTVQHMVYPLLWICNFQLNLLEVIGLIRSVKMVKYVIFMLHYLKILCMKSYLMFMLVKM